MELGKLSLWLVTLAKDQPFSFLDHALRCGDSLVGLISESQVVAFHLDPETGRYNNARLSGAIDEIAGPIMTRVLELREDIEAEPVRDPQQAAVAAGKLQEADGLTARLRNLADAVSAAALSTAGQPADAFDSRLNGIEGDAQRLLTQDGIESPLERAFRARLDAWLKGPRAEPIRPLHWALEFPEVMRQRRLRRHRQQPSVHGRPEAHRATRRGPTRVPDPGHRPRQARQRRPVLLLPAPRSRRSHLAAETGIIATNTIAQGDTREVGLDQVVDMGWAVYRAEKSQRWPGTASLEVALALDWTSRERTNDAFSTGHRVAGITPSLDPVSRMHGQPVSASRKSWQSFQGHVS